MRLLFARIFIILAVLAAALNTPPAPAVLAGDPPCTTRPDNLTRNGSITDGGYPTQYGIVANEWNPFIFNGGAPSYALADNESANGDVAGSSSQYIHADGFQFDAGIYQSVAGTQRGAYYQFIVGAAFVLRDVGGGHNTRAEGVIGRMVGVDPTGGTDPHSPTVMWGQDMWTGSYGQSLNNPIMQMVFAAQSDHVTVYVRAHDVSAAPSDKVFLDVICLLPRGDLPTATPNATATPSPAPTNTPRAAPAEPQSIAAARPVATQPPPTSTSSPTPNPTNTPTVTNTPTITPTRTETPKPHRAIPVSGSIDTPVISNFEASGANIESASGDSGGNMLLLGSLGLIGVSAMGLVCLGAFLALRFQRRPGPREINYS